MARDTLLDFFEDFATSDETFIVHDDGYRVRETTYRQVADAARAFAAGLNAAGIGAGDKVVIWSENRTEWVIALWGTVVAQVVLVPIDFRASADLMARIARIVKAKAVLVGTEVTPPADLEAPVWRLEHLANQSNPTNLTNPDEQNLRNPPNPANLTNPESRRPSPSTVCQIIFTSGATADPKGVTITHRNVLANIVPIEREVKKYLRYERPFHPVRFLNLLPLSHMFGQSMATFVPPMIRGTIVFSHGYSPTEILHQIKSRRISVLVCVPKVLDVLHEHVQRVLPETSGPDTLQGRHFLWRWWRYRRAHRLFGWKFWCVICGAAPLDPGLEAFWRKLGFLVVQGYGLTETAPIVTLNHPFKASRGTVGTPIGGVEVKIAEDGEILVRGENVTTGYFNPDASAAAGEVATTSVLTDGWFHTGDIGEFDANGRLVIKGRKKEMIATAQGLKVFPEDVERVLLAQPGVTDAAVIGLPVDGEERIHAVLVLAPGTDAAAVVRAANAALEDAQRVWSTSIWPGSRLPRTEGTEKLKRHEIRRWAVSGAREAPATAVPEATIEGVVGRFAPGRDISADTTLDELGLSSLDRVELMMALEDAFRVTLDEAAMAETKTIDDVKNLVGSLGSGGSTGSSGSVREGSAGSTGSGSSGSAGSAGASSSASAGAPRRRSAADGPIDFPSWNRWPFIWFLRRISLPTWILPLGRIFMTLDVKGLEHLRGLTGPVVFASNHQSHMDVPAIFLSLPARWRYRTAPAMAKEFFKAHFNRRDYGWKAWLTNSLNYYLSCAFFNTFPLPQREAGARQTLRYIGKILADGYSVLIFPEGARHDTGHIDRFRPGIGMIGARLDVPVIPVKLDGLDRILHPRWRWPKRGRAGVSFGAPLRLTGEDYEALAKQVEEAVRSL